MHTISIEIDGLTFTGVPLPEADFADPAAVYIVLCVAEDHSWTVIDVGRSGTLGTGIESGIRRECWQHKCTSGILWVCKYQMPEPAYTTNQRRTLEYQIRLRHPHLCGT